MKNWMMNRSIRYKLILIVVMSVVPFQCLQLSLLSDLKQELFQDRVLKTRHVVETAYSILDYYLKQEDQGVLTRDEAQKRAIAHIEALRYDSDQYFWINDTRPKMIMHPYKPELNGKDLSQNKDPNGKALFMEMVRVAQSSGGGLVEYQWAKPGEAAPQDKVSYVKLFPAWDWILGSGIYVDDVDSIFEGYVTKFILWLLLVMGLVSVMAWTVSSSVIGRSRKLSEFLEALSRDFNLTKRTDVVGSDELGRTGDSLNHMLEAFQDSVAKVSNSVGSVSSSAENLTGVAQKISDDTARQYREIDLVATAMEEMSATVGEVAANVQRTAAANEDASEKSRHGHMVSEAARSAIGDLASSVQSASEVIRGLERDSTNIGAILDVISGISEQTNLLALNAAIEAARAGDQGRGFAVVADEVRTLSKRTQDSVTEIEDMIRRLQEGSRSAVKVMEQGNLQAARSVEHISEVTSALEQIHQSMSVINDMSGQIAAASEQQSAVANEISANIAGINAAASGTSHGANQCADSSKDLSGLASDLKRATAGFIF